ncbi:hypothetical protein CN601_03415 [Bacillus sp. AFS017336]|nr:hypothetical protein CN601_03415 [Bacillus sp. AFS017336]
MNIQNEIKFFYCYDLSLVKHLRSKNIYYITKAIHPASMKMFFMYISDDTFQTSFKEFKALKSA